MSVFGGRQYRPLLHVRDVGQLVVDAMTDRSSGSTTSAPRT